MTLHFILNSLHCCLFMVNAIMFLGFVLLELLSRVIHECILLSLFWGLKPWWIAVNTVKLVRVVYFELLLLIGLYFLRKPILVESVSSISVYLCQDWEFLLNYNFQSCSILLFFKFTSFGWTRGYGEMEHQPQKAW